MVCYAHRARSVAAIALVVFLVFGRPAGHFLGSAALMVTITLAAAVGAVAAALAFAAFLSTRRRRAAAGGCLRCQFRCQHALTEQPQRLRQAREPERLARAEWPGQPTRDGEPRTLVRTSAAGREPAAPRWPDRPLYRTRPEM